MGAHTTQKLRKISSQKYRRQVKLQAAHRNSTFQSQQSILENKKTILFQTSQQQSKNPMLPGTNQTYCNLWLPNLVQHVSFPNSHMRKKMHQGLLEYLQIRTQRIHKIRQK